MPDAYKEGVRANVNCTHFRRGTLGWGIETYGEIMINMGDIIFSWDSDKTADDFKKMLAAQYETGTPVAIQYILAEPIETPIPAEELAAYRALHTNYPNTTVYSDEDVHMEMGYIADPENYIDQNYVAKESYTTLEQRVAALETQTVNNI